MPDFVYSNDWYDGPRSGVATYGGLPHYFESQWADVYGQLEDWFKLCPISSELFNLELERWELWLAYAAASRAGLVGAEHHPFLPKDRLRGEELTQLLGKELKIEEVCCLVARATFRVLDSHTQQAERAEMEVEWKILAAPPDAASKADFNF